MPELKGPVSADEIIEAVIKGESRGYKDASKHQRCGKGL
jgi:hypothetical protein